MEPDQILAITFTEKAAAEMVERLEVALLECPSIKHPHEVIDQMQISTIHSFCHSILKKYGLMIHQSPHYRVVDAIEKDIISSGHIEAICTDHKDDPPEWLRGVMSVWSYDQLLQILKKRMLIERLSSIG